jgi:ribonuclease HI
VADPNFYRNRHRTGQREGKRKHASSRQKAAGVTVFSDASGQQNHLEATGVALHKDGNITQSQQISVGSIKYWSVYAAELMAIYYAISLVYQISQKKQEALGTGREPATILTDSMSALQAIANSWNKSGQRTIQAILQSARELNTRGIPLRLQWVPGHCNDPGNDTADRLAKEAVGPDKLHPL